MQYEVKIKKLPKSEAEIEVILPAEFLAGARKKAVEMFSVSLNIDGFRKGHVPENVVVEKAGEAGIMEEATDILLKEHFPKIIEQTKLDIVGRPKISITKLASSNPVEFKAVFAVMPEIELPDYKKIARIEMEKKEEKVEATEKEADDVLLQIRKNKAHLDWHEAHKDEKGHNHPEIKDSDLPPLDDELAKAAGNFKNLDELRGKIKENIVAEKKARNAEKKRAGIMEGLLKNTKVEMPEILIESEIQKSLAQMKDDVERMGLKWDEYLSRTKKTDLSAEALAKAEEDLKKDLRDSSEKKAKIQLIFNKIAETEKIEPNKEILENEVKEVLKHYPTASPESARIYVATILINSEVLKLLENTK